MIIGIGCDIIEIVRIEQALARPGFAERVFTPQELAYCYSRGKQAAASLAARFAAKEAALKALGTGLRGGSLQELSVVNDELGKPQLVLSGYFLKLAEQLGVTRSHVSLSHNRTTAIAYIVMEDAK